MGPVCESTCANPSPDHDRLPLSKHGNKFVERKISNHNNKEIGSVAQQKVAIVLQDAVFEADTGAENNIHYLICDAVGRHKKKADMPRPSKY